MHRAIANWKTYTKVILVALCFAVGLSNSYLPLPVVIEKDLSIPFPCQSMGCGCKDANQCWSSCCCHTDAEKLAWAKQRGIAPPAWFLEKVKYAPTSQTQQKSKCCCSQDVPQPQQNDKPSSPGRPKCCCESDEACCCSKKPEPRPTQRVRMTLKEQRGCNGFDDELANLNLELMPLASGLPDFTPLLAETVCSLELRLVSAIPSPPEPIPD